MDKYTIELLTQENAEEIADKWKYPDEYSFYDMTEDIEDYNEIIDPKQRKDNYYQVLKEQELVGFFALVQDGDSIEIGLGLKPELCGNGRGQVFIKLIENYIVKNFNIDRFTLSVAKFNKRAIKLYHKMDYVDCGEEKVNTNGGVYDFINMKKVIK